MKKEKYLRVLETRLKPFSEAEKKEIVSEIAEHFDMGMADGKTEEEISLRLGEPAKLAKQYNTVCRIEKAEQSRKGRDIAAAVASSAGTGILSFFGVVLPSAVGYTLVILLLIVAVGVVAGGVAAMVALVTFMGQSAYAVALSVFITVAVSVLGLLLFVAGISLFKPLNRVILKALQSIKKIFDSSKEREPS
jgi:uncharacterized membrane protein